MSQSRERGPTALRGMQLSQTSHQDLLDALAGAKSKLRLLDVARNSVAPGNEALARLRNLSAAELGELRRETLERLTDLRAELRRRVRD